MKTMWQLIDDANNAINEFEKIPFRCKGFEVLFEWVGEVSELIDTLEAVYSEEGKDGMRLLEAWANEGSSGEDFLEDVKYLHEEAPEMFFLEGADQDVEDPLLKDFLENADNYIQKLISDLKNAIYSVAEMAFHDYQITEALLSDK